MKIKNLLILSGGIALLFALFSGCGERSGKKEYDKAMKSWKAGDLSRAQGQMEKAIKRLSDREVKSVAYNQLGLILWQLGKTEQAADKFGESCGLTEELTGANLNRGIALYHTGQLEDAEFEFTKIANEQPGNTAAHTFTGLIHMQKQEWLKGATEVIKGLKANPSDPGAQNALALAQLHSDRNSDKAVRRLKQLIDAHPDYAPAAYNLAVIHNHWLNDKKTARDWYLQYLERAGSNGPKADAAQQAIARLDQGAAGGGSARTATANPDQGLNHIAEGSRLHTQKRYKEAIARYEQALRADPTNKTAYYNMGLSYYSLKQYSDAARCYEEALKIDSRDTNARYMLVLAYCQQKRWHDAEREAKRLQSLDSKQGESMMKYIKSVRGR